MVVNEPLRSIRMAGKENSRIDAKWTLWFVIVVLGIIILINSCYNPGLCPCAYVRVNDYCSVRCVLGRLAEDVRRVKSLQGEYLNS